MTYSRVIQVFFSVCYFSFHVANSGATELNPLVVDFAAMHNGQGGIRAIAKVSRNTNDAPSLRNAKQHWSLTVNQQLLVPMQLKIAGNNLIIEFFSATKQWPSAAKPTAHLATLLYRDQVIKQFDLVGPSNGIAFVAGYKPTVSSFSDGLAGPYTNAYLVATSQAQQQWFKALAQEHNWLDLGHLAYARAAYVEAAYFYAMAADDNQRDSLAPAWLAHTVKLYQPYNASLLLPIEAALKRRLLKLQRQGSAQAAVFGEKQDQAEQKVKALQQQFSQVQGALNALGNQSRDDAQALKLSEKLTTINSTIRDINDNLQDRLSDIERPTPFMIKALFEIQISLSRLAVGAKADGPNQQAWLDAALATAQLPYAQSFNPAGLDRSLRARVLLRKAALSDQQAQLAKIALESDPAFAQQKPLQDKHQQQLAELEKLRLTTDAAAAELSRQPALQNKAQKAEQAVNDFAQAQAQLRQAEEVFNGEQKQLQADRAALGERPTEAARAAFNKKIDLYNEKIQQLDKRSARVQAKADVANATSQVYNQALNEAQNNNNQAYNRQVNRVNQTLSQLTKITTLVGDKDRLYKDLIFDRDQNLALSKDELYRLMSNAPTRNGSRLLASVDSVLALPTDSLRLFTEKLWCSSLNFNCGQCFGLATLGCTFAELDAIRDCNNGIATQFSLPAVGSGGILGACRGSIAISVTKKRWQVANTGRKPSHSSAQEHDSKQAVTSAIADTLAPLFDKDASCGVAQPSTTNNAINDNDGLSAYLGEFEAKLAEQLKQRQQQALQQQKLDQATRRLALVKQNSEFANDPEIAELLARFESQPGALAQPKNAALLTDKLAQRAVHAIQTDIANNGNQAQWEQKARRINEISKQANDLAQEFGLQSESLKKLTGYVDNAASILDGARDGNVDKVRTGIQGFIGSVPGPVGSLLTTPQGYVLAGTLQYTSDITSDSTAVLKDFNAYLDGSDPGAEQRMLAGSQALQDKLNPRAYIKKAFIEPVRSYFENEVPGGKTLIKVFDYFASEAKPGSCAPPGPALEIPSN